MNISTRRKKRAFATPVHQEQIAVEQIVHPQIQEQIVEGVMEIPQERLLEGIEEQIGDVLVPQSVCYIAPTPVIQDVTPAPSILYPAPKADYATQTSVIGVHRIGTISDRFISQSTVASCLHHDSRHHWYEFDNQRGEPAMCYHSCEGSAPQVVGSLLLLGEFASPVDNQNTSGTDRCRGDDPDRCCSCSMSPHRIRSRQLPLDFNVTNYMSRILLNLSLYGPPKFWDQSAVIEFSGHVAPHETCIARVSSWAHCWLSSHSLQRACTAQKITH